MEENKPRLIKKHIVYIATAITVLVLFLVFSCNSNPIQQPEESTPVTTDSLLPTSTATEPEPVEETLSEEDRNLIIRSSIDQAVLDWESGIIDYEAAITILSEIQDTCNPELADYAESHRKQIILSVIDSTVADWIEGSTDYENATSIISSIQESNTGGIADYAKEKLEYLAIENKGNTLLELAKKFLGVKNYVQVLTNLNEIEQAYSKYDSVSDAYRVCEEQVLQAVSNPETEEQFESYIKLLGDCNELYSSKNFTDRKTQLSDELIIFRDVSETIDAATLQFDSQNIQESFILLALGLEKHPDDERLAATLVNYRDHYVISITKQAVALCQQKEYKEALQIVEIAIEEYDCDEFQLLREAIKEEKSFLYRLKNDIVDTFTSVTAGWKKEEFDVKQAANDAGAYVVKSGKKLALGDYTDENVTLLSFSGNVAASLLGADLLFDLRDLSYDITHWGEEEYFAVWLAADVVALLPVIGVVKYFSHFKTVANGLEATSELVDSAADIAKNAENASEIIDTISDVTKAGDDIADAIDNAKDAVKAGEAAKDVASDVLKGFTLIETINQKLLGTAHEKTGVKFVLSKIELSDGRKLKGVFPKFDSFADVELPKELYKANFYDQQKECMEQLQKQLKNPFSKLRDKFTEEQIEDIMNGVLPEGFTWHHNEQEGLMQLVDSVIHNQTNHTGGMSIWGKGY